jgi:hypothetical protein
VKKRRGLINFLIVLTLLVFFVVGCSVLLRAGGDDGGDGAAGNGDGGTATMTFAQFQSVSLDPPRDQIVERFGESTPRQEIIDQGLIPDDPTTEGCIYYKADPPTFGEWFEFCFEEDKLSNKTSL